MEFWNLLMNVDADSVKHLASDNMAFAMALCFASGILTSLTPCVYPMIPITINIFGRLAQAEGHATGKKFNPRVFGLSAIYVAGMCATYSIMGLFAGLTGSLFGKILQSPIFLGFLTLLFFALALGQFGLFKMELPPSWQTKLATAGHARSGFGIFMMGLFSGLIVSPCVGPVIAGILAFVFDSSNAFKGFLYFLSFSLGLGVLFLTIGGFSGLLSQLPRSGAWMNRVNRALAVLMLVASGYYGYLLLKQTGVIKTAHQVDQFTSAVLWHTDEKTALDEAGMRNVPVIVDFTAEWCESCHVIDKKVFQNPTVIEKLKQHTLLRIDVTQENAVNEAILKRYGVLSLPAVVFLNKQGKLLENPRVHGVITPEAFIEMLSKI